MSTHFIESPFLKIEVKMKAHRCFRSFDRERGFEYLYREGMRNHFPVVGNLKDDRYRIGRKYYRMQSNGFLMDQEFEVLQHEDDRIRLQFQSSDQTFAVYPYRFLFKIDYFVCCANSQNHLDH